MPKAGTLTIWRTITLAYRAPTYARRYRYYQSRRAQSAQRPTALKLVNAFIVTGFAMVFIGCCMTSVGWSLVGRVIGSTTISAMCGLTLASGFIFFPGIGAIILSSRIAWAVRSAKQRQLWDHMLLLPHPRHEVTLYSIAHAYEPGLFILSLSIIGIVSLMLASQATHLFLWRLGTLSALLVIEWVQWIAISVSVGLLGGSEHRLDLALPFLYGALLVIARGFGGIAVATLLDFPSLAVLAALLIGPMCGIASPDAHRTGLVIAGVYLLAMEIGVRGLFGWALWRVNER